MPRDRAERLALTEAAFRIANERMAAWEDAPADGEALYFCECSVFECREKLSLTRAQYEEVRARPEHFVVAPGHEVLEIEAVVARDGAFFVVEKPEAVMELVRGSDPRALEPGEARADAEELADGI
jgi:hypothetical protein